MSLAGSATTGLILRGHEIAVQTELERLRERGSREHAKGIVAQYNASHERHRIVHTLFFLGDSPMYDAAQRYLEETLEATA